jgi:hypothetical protein
MRRSVILLVLVCLAACGGGAGGTTTSPTAAPSTTTTSTTPTISTTSSTEATTTTVEVQVSAGGWARVPHDEALFGGAGDQWMRSVVAGGPGLVGVGYDESGGDADAAVWTSPDGLTWTKVAHEESLFGGAGDQMMNAVVAGGPGLVAVGLDESVGDTDAAVWTSPDGLTWSRVPHDDAVFGGPEAQLMYSAVAGDMGLVVVGLDASGGDGDGAVWTSLDGLTWSRVPHNEQALGGSDHQIMNHVALGGPGLVAVGTDSPSGPANAAVWYSPDGLVWTRVPHDEQVFGGPDRQAITSVAEGGPGLVGIGYDLADFESVVWTSPDGLTWTRMGQDDLSGGPGPMDLWSVVVAGGPGLVAIGYSLSGNDSDAAVWTSPDGLTWTREPHDEAVFGGPGFQEMVWITPGGPGLVAVGYDSAGGDWDTAVWYWTPDD